MPTLELTTTITAPVERCFDLSRSIDLHLQAAKHTGERVIAGVTRGLIDLGQSVRWRARHFALTFEMTNRIVSMERPYHFRDDMIDGPFARFEHDHFFEQLDEGTRMRDVLFFAAPCGVLVRAVDRFLLARHLRRFLQERNRVLKEVAESSDQWKQYLSV